jgi:hypothetical protein
MKPNRCSLALALSIPLGHCLLSVTALASSQDAALVQRDFDGFSVRVSKQSSGFSVSVSDANGRPRGNVRLAGIAESISDVRVSTKHIFVTGRFGSAFVVYLIDLKRPSLVDTIVGSRLSIAPDGRYIAYRRTVPRTQTGDDVCLIYDTLKPPHANRMTTEIDDLARATDSGIAVFPERHRLERNYEVTVDDRVGPHRIRSPLVWIDSNTISLS